MSTYRRLLVFLLVILFAGSCASIPKEAPALSGEIGKEVSKMHTAHLALVRKYFDLKREQVSRIFEEEWVPAYAESFFSQPQVADYWDKLVSEGDKEERVQFLIQLGPRMLGEIRSKRAEYMKPLDELEARITDSLQYRYRQILSASNTLTSFLMSSSKVAQNRERYLELVGLEQKEVQTYIDRADKRSEQIIETIRKAHIN